MSVSNSVKSAASKVLRLTLVALIATTSFAQNAAPQSSQANLPTVAPAPVEAMPQAPKPQNNAHLYSDQDYTKGQSSFPKS